MNEMQINIMRFIGEMNKLLDDVPEEYREKAILKITVGDEPHPVTGNIETGFKFDVTF